MDNPFDPVRFPHLFHLVLFHLSHNDVLTLRNVSRTMRKHVDPRLLKHLVVGSFHLPHPVSIHSTNGQGPTIPWTMVPASDNKSIAAQHAALSQMRKYCVVMDIANDEEFSSQDERRRAAFGSLRSLPNLHTVRRLTPCGFQPAVDTIIDFAVTNVARYRSERPLNMRCNRYVVPNLLVKRFIDTDTETETETGTESSLDSDSSSDADETDDVQAHSTFGLHRYRTQHLEDVVLHGLAGLEEVVLIFKIGGSTHVFFVLAFLIEHVTKLVDVDFTFVGLEDYMGVTSGAEVQLEFEQWDMPGIPCDPAIVRNSVKFMSHSEYREEVGKETYRLETKKEASFW